MESITAFLNFACFKCRLEIAIAICRQIRILAVVFRRSLNSCLRITLRRLLC